MWVVLGDFATRSLLTVWDAARLACARELAGEAEAWLGAPPDRLVAAAELLRELAEKGCRVVVGVGLPAVPAELLARLLEARGAVDAEAVYRLARGGARDRLAAAPESTPP